MAKARTTSTTTRTSNANLDAELFAMIKRCAEASDESLRLDEAWADAAKRANQDPAIAEALREQSRQRGHEAGRLELAIRAAKVRTIEGLAAKIDFIRRAEFRGDEMPSILETLRADAEAVAAAR